MPDLSDQIFNGIFDVPVLFYTDKNDVTPVDAAAIISEGFDPGSEAGKGVTKTARKIEANFGRILLKQSEVTTKPGVHAIVIDDGVEWDILSADDTKAGTWRCTAKKNVRGQGHRRG